MKCKECNIELEGNECPKCGAKAVIAVEIKVEKETIAKKVEKVFKKKGKR